MRRGLKWRRRTSILRGTEIGSQGTLHVQRAGRLSRFDQGARPCAAVALGNSALSGAARGRYAPRRALAVRGAAVLPRALRQSPVALPDRDRHSSGRSEEHTSELQSLMRISYAVFFLKKKQYTDNAT